MLTLYSAPPSPFGRKVRLAAAMLGIDLSIVNSDTLDAQDPIRALNPLGKIPALVLESGAALYDSAVILDYLDAKASGALVPGTERRFAVLTQEALADGLIDAAVLQVYEDRFRSEAKREPRWVAHQAGKVERALAAFEAAPPEGGRTVADIALACALGYLDLRFAGTWRTGHPRLVSWLDAFAAEVPAFEATRFAG